MNTDVIESVLHEILNGQKEADKLSKQLVNKMEYLCGEIENLHKATNNHRNVASSDTKAFEIITDSIENIKQVIAVQQKNSICEKRIMIFPEFKSAECYRLLFNCIIYITIATYGFLIIKAIVDHWCKI